MFYSNSGFNESTEGETRAIVVLTPSESKRLIAKAVTILPEIKNALKNGRIIISEGTTNAYIVEEIFGVEIRKEAYACGVISNGGMATVATERIYPYLIKHGKPYGDISDRMQNGRQADAETCGYMDYIHPEENWRLHEELIDEFEPDDVVIKGATAVDHCGNAGVFVVEGRGGSIGRDLPVILSRGCHLLVPVGLEKLVPSVVEATRYCGSMRFRHAFGFSPGILPLVNGKVVTEIQALRILTGVHAIHVGSGGVGYSQGAVVLSLVGVQDVVDNAFNLVESIKGEPPIMDPCLLPDVKHKSRFMRFFPFQARDKRPK